MVKVNVNDCEKFFHVVCICAPPSLLKEFDSIGIGFWPGVSITCGRDDHGGDGERGHGGRR